MKEYSIHIVDIEEINGQKIYTYNICRELFFNLICIPKHTIECIDPEEGYKSCLKWIANNKGIFVSRYEKIINPDRD
jgi:hypothetical protein